MGTPREDPEQVLKETSELLFVMTGRLQGLFNATAAELDLPPAQALSLLHLHTPAPMRELAERLACDASNVTGIVDGLERRGLVTRQADPRDRRVKHLVFTDKGRSRREALYARVQAGAAAVINLPPGDMRILHGLLTRALAAGGDLPRDHASA